MKFFALLRHPRHSEESEWLDAAAIPQHDLDGNLRELRQLNAYLGSCWLIRRATQRLWKRAGCPRHWRVLDIGTGAGDMPLTLLRWGQRRGVRVTVVAIDYHAGVVQQARKILSGQHAVDLLRADGLRLPFAAESFDVTLCSSMLHHLAWQEGVMLLRSMATVARHGVVINDLVRGWFPYYMARLLLMVWARNPYTRHDGPLSVLRAYTVAELGAMAREAGLSGAQVRLALGYRVVLLYTPGA